MEIKEFKEKTQSKVVDIIANLGVFTPSEIMDIKDVREAKKNFDELSDLINEYIKEYEKPKFKVGDYVVEEGETFTLGKVITLIEEYIKEDDEFWGSYYIPSVNKFENYSESGTPNIEEEHARLATQDEIAEYEAALTFHKRGRKPFELKRGDVVYLKGYDKNIFLDSGNIYKKHNFVDGDVVLVKTAEEVNEWLENK